MRIPLLIIGYLLAVPPLFRLWTVVRKAIWWVWGIETIGSVFITLGWIMSENRGAAIVNGTWAVLWGVGFPLWQLRKRRRRLADEATAATATG